MDGEEPFLRAMWSAPDDEAPRLVYADWLDERGYPGRAAYLRLIGRTDAAEGHRELREALDLDWLFRVDPAAIGGAPTARGPFAFWAEGYEGGGRVPTLWGQHLLEPDPPFPGWVYDGPAFVLRGTESSRPPLYLSDRVHVTGGGFAHLVAPGDPGLGGALITDRPGWREVYHGPVDLTLVPEAEAPAAGLPVLGWGPAWPTRPAGGGWVGLLRGRRRLVPRRGLRWELRAFSPEPGAGPTVGDRLPLGVLTRIGDR